MYQVVSLFPPPYELEVKNLLQYLQDEFALQDEAILSPPGFIWHRLRAGKEAEISETLKTIAAEMPTFEIRTTGFGVFTGENPQFYIPIVKSPDLTFHQQKIWQTCHLTTSGTNPEYPEYEPEEWIPQIALTKRGIAPEKVHDIVLWLSEQPLNWVIPIDHIGLMVQKDNQVPELKFQFGLFESTQ